MKTYKLFTLSVLSLCIITLSNIAVLAQDTTAISIENEFQDFENKKLTLPDFTTKEYNFLNLGVDEDYMKMERFRTRDQILTFIPPFFQPAFVGDGYVLPPNTWRISIHSQTLEVNSNDFFKDGQTDRVHENHNINRTQTDFDLFYGLDYDMTLRINVPLWSTKSAGSIHPAGVAPINLFVEGNNTKLGDISIFLKKKFFDQGNSWLNFAGVIGVIIPTGSDNEKFDDKLIMTSPSDPNGTIAFNGMPFPRFSDDGNLPTTLQPGIGKVGLIFGLMGTKQFERSALHFGSLININDIGKGENDIHTGNEIFYFASYVHPILSDKLSVELAFNGKWKGDDFYPGTFLHPMTSDPSGFGMPIMEIDPVSGMMTPKMFNTPRPSFSGGWIGFISPSLIFNPYSQIRFELSAMIRVISPELGPAPNHMLRAGIVTTF